jgi:uncharacterized protein YpbB
VGETLRYFREGYGIEEIAAKRGLTAGTIESHLATGISNGEIGIEKLVSGDELEMIRAELRVYEQNRSLTEIKHRLPPEISYGKIRMAISWISRNGK